MEFDLYEKSHYFINKSEINNDNDYQTLISIVVAHNELYYINSKPIISDFEYDILFDILKKYEYNFPDKIVDYSPTINLKNQLDWFNKESHWNYPLLSLDNTYNNDDILSFNKSLEKTLWQNIIYTVEPKYDWLSIHLIYKEWKLVQAITRWNWQEWDDVTINVKTIRNLPLHIPLLSEIHLRWEIVISKSEFEKLNNEIISKWWEWYSNARNLASWTLKQLNTNIVSKRNLECYIYDILSPINWINTQEQLYTFLKEMGFMFLDLNIVWTIDTVLNEGVNNEKIKELLWMQNIEFDWLVIKINNFNLRKEVWTTWHHPRWAFAYKYPTLTLTTKLLNIQWQVWRTWILTPVAILKPVNINWVIVEKATLHNYDQILKLDLNIWDIVYIQRSWEVIPYITWKVYWLNENIEKISIPEECTICNSKTTLKDNFVYCVNKNCKGIIAWNIKYFVSKDCLNIEWLWEKFIEKLVQLWILNNIFDIFELHKFEDKLKEIDGIWDKKLKKIFEEIEKTKEKDLWRLINWLWINWVGKWLSKDIARNMPWDWNDFNSYFINYQGEWIWEIITKNIKEFINKNENIWEQLANLWFFKNTKKKEITNNIHNNFNFAITGSFPISRDIIIEKLESIWWIYWSPSKKTNYMFIWDKAWSKREKAIKMWLNILEDWNIICDKFPVLK